MASSYNYCMYGSDQEKYMFEIILAFQCDKFTFEQTLSRFNAKNIEYIVFVFQRYNFYSNAIMFSKILSLHGPYGVLNT